MDNTALLVVDMQNGMLERQVYAKEFLINNVNSLLDYFHQNNGYVFFIRHTNKSFSQINTKSWEIYHDLKQDETDIVLNKSHSSIFKEKAFRLLLDEHTIKHIVVVGLVSNGCVQATCLDVQKQGLFVTLISDAHSTWHKDAQQVVSNWNNELVSSNIRVIITKEFMKL